MRWRYRNTPIPRPFVKLEAPDDEVSALEAMVEKHFMEYSHTVCQFTLDAAIFKRLVEIDEFLSGFFGGRGKEFVSFSFYSNMAQ